ncbi:MAG TPA: thioredoxin family protein, partial [Acidobacteriota bacterium]|nr:thioredoxin family protein [Acidobacteriota bacterium]
MNSKILVAIAISALIISVAALLTGRSDSLDWHRDYASALATAKARNQMVVAYIYTDWCMYCKKMEAETFSSEQVKREAGRFVWLKLNPEQDADGARLRQQYAL